MRNMHIYTNRLIFSLFFLIFAGTAYAAPNIALVGDSITSGYPEVDCGRGISGRGGYAPYLEAMLSGNFLNFGIAGDRASYALVEFSHRCSDETWVHNGQRITQNQLGVALESSHPQYTLYLMGTNDLAYHSASTVVKYIEVGINAMLDAGTIPIVGTILPDTRSKGDSKDIVGANRLLRNLLNKMDVQRAEFYNATSVDNWDDMMSDGIHPDDDGRYFMAKVWYSAIKEQMNSAMQEQQEQQEQIEEQNKAKIAGALAGVRSLLLGSEQ